MEKNAVTGTYEAKRDQTLDTPLAPMCASDAAQTSHPTVVESLADMIGEFAATLERAQELPGKVADAQRLRYRLLLRQAEIERRILRLDSDIAIARTTGHEFNARRLTAEVRTLEEERIDATAMLLEVDRVLQRLRRERRSLIYRLACGEALIDAFPPGPRKITLHEMLNNARRRLVTRHLPVAAMEQ
jgi:hypothetical protein